MIRKKRIAIFLALLTVLTLGVGAAALEIDCDSEHCFSSSEFSEEGLEGVCITALPDASAGTVLLGQRVIRCGDILTAAQLDELVFRPLRTQEDAIASISYLPVYKDRVEKAVTMTISIRGKRDRAPVAEDSTLETYKNLPNSGVLKAHDPEGEALTFSITRAPRRGEVTIDADGVFTYTPKKNKIGTDSFTYTATDPAGNVSRQATVTVQILKPCDKQTYSDTLGSDSRFVAEWLRNEDIFTGEIVGGKLCFCPEQTVSRGQFMAMLVRTLDLPLDEDATYTGFTDECPSWLRPYLAAALRAGLSADWTGGSVFGANEPITGAEAALLMQNALALPTLSGETENVDLIAVMAENGITLDGGTLTRAQVAKALYRLSKLTSATVF